MKKILIRTVDTDVVILAIAFLHKLEEEEPGLHLVLASTCGTCRSTRYLAHSPYSNAKGYHSFMPSADVIRYRILQGKKTAFQAWKCYPEATTVFRSLSSPQTLVSEEQFRVLKRFVVIMSSRTTPHQNVNMERQTIFSQGTRGIESIPPTQAALEQHVKRAVFQAGHVWGRAH